MLKIHVEIYMKFEFNTLFSVTMLFEVTAAKPISEGLKLIGLYCEWIKQSTTQITYCTEEQATNDLQLYHYI